MGIQKLFDCIEWCRLITSIYFISHVHVRVENICFACNQSVISWNPDVIEHIWVLHDSQRSAKQRNSIDFGQILQMNSFRATSCKYQCDDSIWWDVLVFWATEMGHCIQLDLNRGEWETIYTVFNWFWPTNDEQFLIKIKETATPRAMEIGSRQNMAKCSKIWWIWCYSRMTVACELQIIGQSRFRAIRINYHFRSSIRRSE